MALEPVLVGSVRRSLSRKAKIRNQSISSDVTGNNIISFKCDWYTVQLPVGVTGT